MRIKSRTLRVLMSGRSEKEDTFDGLLSAVELRELVD